MKPAVSIRSCECENGLDWYAFQLVVSSKCSSYISDKLHRAARWGPLFQL